MMQFFVLDFLRGPLLVVAHAIMSTLMILPSKMRAVIFTRFTAKH